MTLDNYAEPTQETVGAFRRIAEDLWRRLRPATPRKAAIYETLWEIDTDVRDRVVSLPDYGPVGTRLDNLLAPWIADKSPEETTQLLVYPPGNDGRFLREWAEDRTLTILDPPDLETSGRELPKSVESLAQSGTVVIPALQHWFVRKVGGMDMVRAMLVRVCESENRVILGCESWAWQYLIKSIDAHHLLPEAKVVQALTADEIRAWFADMVEGASLGADVKFRSARDGSDIFAKDSGYFRQLALESIGIPWVAWAIWRRSLFTTKRDELSDSVWVRHPTTPDPPETDEREASLILHALLVHGGLPPGWMREVLPLVGADTVIAMLQRKDLVEIREDRLHITPEAYPSIKIMLEDASYPGDGL